MTGSDKHVSRWGSIFAEIDEASKKANEKKRIKLQKRTQSELIGKFFFEPKTSELGTKF